VPSTPRPLWAYLSRLPLGRKKKPGHRPVAADGTLVSNVGGPGDPGKPGDLRILLGNLPKVVRRRFRRRHFDPAASAVRPIECVDTRPRHSSPKTPAQRCRRLPRSTTGRTPRSPPNLASIAPVLARPSYELATSPLTSIISGPRWAPYDRLPGYSYGAESARSTPDVPAGFRTWFPTRRSISRPTTIIRSGQRHGFEPHSISFRADCTAKSACAFLP